MQSVFDARLLLFHFHLGGGPDLQNRDPADQLRQALLQLLLIVVAGGGRELGADLLDPTLDRLRRPSTIDDRGRVLVEDHALGAPEIGQGHVLELAPELFADGLSAGQRRHVLQHRLAPVAEVRRLDGGAIQRAAEFVDDQRGERLAFDVVGDDQQGLVLLGDGLEQGQQILHVRELLLADQDEGLLEHDLHALSVRHEVRREVASVELHSFDHLERGLGALAFFDGDHAFSADLLHGLREFVADLLVAVGADRADLRDLFRILGGLRHLPQRDRYDLDGFLDAALEIHGVVPRGHEPRAFSVDGLGEDRRRRGAVAGHVAGLARHLAHHLRAHVLEGIVELDFLGDGHAVLGDRRRAVALLEHDVAPARAERDLDDVGQSIDPREHSAPCVLCVEDIFG